MNRICHTGLPQQVPYVLGQKTELFIKHSLSPKVYFSPIYCRQMPISYCLKFHDRKEAEVQRKKRVFVCQDYHNEVSQALGTAGIVSLG